MANNQVVNRKVFEAFLVDQDGDGPLFDILRGIPEAQRQPLFDVGKSVCKIDAPICCGTGFHHGGGWIITALHVISKDDSMRAEYVSKLTFEFPNKPVIEAAFRSCIFPSLPPPSAVDVNHEVMDIALIHVPELLEFNIPGLAHIFQEPPQAGDRVHLVHFGDPGDHQFFSINGKICPDSMVQQDTPYRYSIFKAFSPEGSSGAPLVTFRKDVKKFLVAGVHYEGFEEDEDRHGCALWFTHEHWLQSTVLVASNTVGKILQEVDEIPAVERYMIPCYVQLQDHLTEHNLQIIVDKLRPSFLLGAFQNIIFKAE